MSAHVSLSGTSKYSQPGTIYVSLLVLVNTSISIKIVSKITLNWPLTVHLSILIFERKSANVHYGDNLYRTLWSTVRLLQIFRLNFCNLELNITSGHLHWIRFKSLHINVKSYCHLSSEQVELDSILFSLIFHMFPSVVCWRITRFTPWKEPFVFILYGVK